MNYAAGFGMAMMTYAQIFYFCETGVINKNLICLQSLTQLQPDSFWIIGKKQENGLDNLLCELDWQYLPNDLQKNVMQLMQRTQNGVKLTVGPFETINREHCKIVSNTH